MVRPDLLGISLFAVLAPMLSADPGKKAEPVLHQKSEPFDKDPLWDGHNNRVKVHKPNPVIQDFGFSITNHAGGKEAGEICGRVQRSTTSAYYGMPLDQAKTLDSKLRCSGSFAVTESMGTAGLPGTKAYGAVVTASSGIIYGVAADKYYAFDPVSRKTLFTGALPVKSLHFPELADEPFGPRGLIYGLGDDAIFAINPADHSIQVVARNDALKTAHGFAIAHDGMLYFGSGSHLMRTRLPKQD